MSEVIDPELLKTLRKTLVSREDLSTLVEYQQRLYASLKQLNENHKTIHDHVALLTESHNIVREDANKLLGHMSSTNDVLHSLTDSYAKTREEIERANETLNYIKQQIERFANLEDRLSQLEKALPKPPETSDNQAATD